MVLGKVPIYYKGLDNSWIEINNYMEINLSGDSVTVQQIKLDKKYAPTFKSSKKSEFKYLSLLYLIKMYLDA